MVQNLNLNLSTSVSLNSTTSDLTEGRTWTPNSNTQTTTGTAWARDTGNIARSYNPGNYYYTNGYGTGTVDGYRNLSGGKTTSGQPWFHLGNYYNWYAATAGTGTASMGGEDAAATDSICPRGWQLSNSSGAKSFAAIWTAYDMKDNDVASVQKAISSPLNFVMAGYYTYSGKIYDQGSGGRFYKNKSYTYNNLPDHAQESSIWYLEGRAIAINGGPKGHGLSIRCLAR